AGGRVRAVNPVTLTLSNVAVAVAPLECDVRPRPMNTSPLIPTPGTVWLPPWTHVPGVPLLSTAQKAVKTLPLRTSRIQPGIGPDGIGNSVAPVPPPGLSRHVISVWLWGDMTTWTLRACGSSDSRICSTALVQ